MCILFILVGDNTRTTIICNNRDEYFQRSTQRGILDAENGTYSPTDNEGGGTWLSFGRLNGNDRSRSSSLRFAVVLNLHDWRSFQEEEFYAERSSDTDPKNLLSRGLLIKDFMSEEAQEGGLTARAYAADVFSRRSQYRPFNLVVGDESGTFYVTAYPLQLQPERLVPGKLYGITNGPLHCPWEKVEAGIDQVASALLRILPGEEYVPYIHGTGRGSGSCEGRQQGKTPVSSGQQDDVVSPSSTSIIDIFASNGNAMIKRARRSKVSNGSMAVGFCSNLSGATATTYAPQIADALLSVMEDDSPRADPSLGCSSAPLMRLNGLFVRPVYLIRSPYPWQVWMAVAVFAISGLLQLLISLLLRLWRFFTSGRAGHRSFSNVAAYRSELRAVARRLKQVFIHAVICASTSMYEHPQSVTHQLLQEQGLTQQMHHSDIALPTKALTYFWQYILRPIFEHTPYNSRETLC